MFTKTSIRLCRYTLCTKARLEKEKCFQWTACLLQHHLDPDTPMEEIVRAFNWCIDKGMALYWGTSEWPAYLITEAMHVANRLNLIAPITEVQ